MKIALYRKWTFKFARWGVILLGVVALFNFCIDPDGVFGVVRLKGFNRVKTDVISDRITKFYYVGRCAPGAVMLGSSRMATLDPGDVARYTGGRVYNLALANPSMYEQYHYLRYVVEKGGVKTAVLAVDLFSFNPLREKYQTGFALRRLEDAFHPMDYVDGLISATVTENSIKTLKANLAGKAVEENYETGMWTWNRVKSVMRKMDDPLKHIRARTSDSLRVYANGKRLYNHPPFEKPESIRDDMEQFREIVRYARRKGVDLKVLVSPIYYKQFDLIYAKNLGTTFEQWKRALARVTPYHDFTGHNSVTTDISWWWDSSHINAEGGRLIFARLFGDTSVPVPGDFGVLVTESNVEAHIARLRKQVRSGTVEQVLGD